MALGNILASIKLADRNFLINGAFEIDQTNAGGAYSSPGANSYGLDRWIFEAGTSLQRVSVVGRKFQHACQVSSTAALNQVKQRIEAINARELYGKKATFSVLMRLDSGAVSAQPKIKIEHANVADDFSSVTQVGIDENLISSSAIDGTYKIFHFTFDVTSNMAEKGFQVTVGDFGSATNVIHYALAHLKEGAGLTSFLRAGITFPGEAYLCRRYLEKSWDLDVAIGTVTEAGAHFMHSVTGVYGPSHVNFKADKRIIGTENNYSTATGTITNIRNWSDSVDLSIGSFARLGISNMGYNSIGGGVIADKVYAWHWVVNAEL